jgi:hypothetical protein
MRIPIEQQPIEGKRKLFGRALERYRNKRNAQRRLEKKRNRRNRRRG